MSVRIGCSSAFWGDSIAAARQLVQQGQLDYLVADYLAEVTMGILAKRRQKTEQKALGGAGVGGFVAEFVTFVWKPLMRDIVEKKIKVITNAGGLDPVALKVAMEKAAQEAGLDNCPKIAAVYGDDILPNLAKLQASASIQPFTHLEGSGDVETIPKDKKLESLNAYLGADPIRRALDEGAQIVVTGRCVDSALVLGALMHEFQWSLTDYDCLAGGSLAGHIIECGCQATGGNFTDWELSARSENGGWANMGYPIVECAADGSFIVTKPDKTGGLVTLGTVGEQMVYEIGDPGSYILPDVIVDLRQVTLAQIGKDRVQVKGVRGRSPTPFLKVSGIYMDGFKVTGELFIGGINAAQKVCLKEVDFYKASKAYAVGEAIVMRVRGMLKKLGFDDFRATNIEVLGAEHTYGPHARSHNTREAVLRLSAHHNEARALGFFLMEIAPSATCMAPGIIGVSSGRPRPQGNMVHFSVLVKKDKVTPMVAVGTDSPCACPFPRVPPVKPATTIHSPRTVVALSEKKLPLVTFCIARSGDKGDSANIGVIVRNPKNYSWLKQVLTEEIVFERMKHLMGKRGKVKRYELPGCNALNFLVTNCLGGGGLSSLQIDRQGKTYAQILLSMEVPAPKELKARL